MPSRNRYVRQEVLPEIGPAGQEKIANASILCIGAGGLGSPALLYLAAAGVGRIGVIDFDAVEETNLQRQVLFTVDQLRQNKAKAARMRLHALNPEIEIQAYPEELTADNAESLFADYDLILDGSDNFATKFLINDAAVKTGKPFIYGSILSFDGQVAVFNAPMPGGKRGPCYRCLFPAPPQTHIPNCAEAGVIGAVAGIIGSMQAMEALKIIAGHDSFAPLAGKLWTVDLRSMDTRLLTLGKNPECAVCAGDAKSITLHYESPVCGVIPEVTPAQIKAMEPPPLLVDVREAEEWAAGHIDGARHLALSTLMEGHHPDLPADCEIVLYCQKGKRSLQAARILKAQGLTNIASMTGGYEAWVGGDCPP